MKWCFRCQTYPKTVREKIKIQYNNISHKKKPCIYRNQACNKVAISNQKLNLLKNGAEITGYFYGKIQYHTILKTDSR